MSKERENAVRGVLKTYVEPHLGADLESAGAVEAVQVDDGAVALRVALGHRGLAVLVERGRMAVDHALQVGSDGVGVQRLLGLVHGEQCATQQEAGRDDDNDDDGEKGAVHGLSPSQRCAGWALFARGFCNSVSGR